MHEFDWGTFWAVLLALIGYGALKFLLKRMLGLYDVRSVHVVTEAEEESDEEDEERYRLESMTGPPQT